MLQSYDHYGAISCLVVGESLLLTVQIPSPHCTFHQAEFILLFSCAEKRITFTGATFGGLTFSSVFFGLPHGELEWQGRVQLEGTHHQFLNKNVYKQLAWIMRIIRGNLTRGVSSLVESESSPTSHSLSSHVPSLSHSSTNSSSP
jgi:hypothetical protein